MEAEIAIIGGSGIYSVDLIKNPQTTQVSTPYGESPEIIVGKVEDRKVAFIPRHGKAHSTPPHLINYRANLWSLNDLGVERVLATTAVGSLNPKVEPGQFVLLDQFVDFAKRRPLTFYEGGEEGVVHVDITEPYCPELRNTLEETAGDLKINLIPTGTYVCTEGPRYETRAEIQLFHDLGFDVVGMTNATEAILARELEMCYSTVSMVTNFGAGISKEKLTHKEVSELMSKNIDRVKKLLFTSIPAVPEERNCPCKDALEGARVEA
ncbi:5'-methylthioadenosine phosphorylase [candidate division MSBL1 archaeon SCGC-AAA261F17]|uniref:Purine nucleoside phosphorylase n=1 Tax=candidate division MSBL1 archaeon SCGC-AAA261F17 TaxID=1698274 RepID=A0A133V6F3_9EURY|nr:5'-methylthioadenosine phosphorylase [candidate division MSBL1 archaeon SCGC-AAA261F17]